MAYYNRSRHRRSSSGSHPRESDVILVKWYEDVYYVTSWPKNKEVKREDLARELADQDEPYETADAAREAAEALLAKLPAGAELREVDMEDYPAAEPVPVTTLLEADGDITFVKKNA